MLEGRYRDGTNKDYRDISRAFLGFKLRNCRRDGCYAANFADFAAKRTNKRAIPLYEQNRELFVPLRSTRRASAPLFARSCTRDTVQELIDRVCVFLFPGEIRQMLFKKKK